MAAHLNPPLKEKAGALFPGYIQFQRGGGKTAVKKIQRKITVRPGHIIIFFLVLGGVFFGIQRFSLFLLTWENLFIKNIEVSCGRPEVGRDIFELARRAGPANLLLLDISRLQEKMTGHRWVKRVGIRKVFPSTLHIEVEEREPAAVLQKKESFHLIDREGVHLETIDSRNGVSFPIFVDSDDFGKDYDEKIRLAWECLDSLADHDRERVEILDLSGFNTISLRFRGSSIWIILGGDDFLRKLEFLRDCRPKLEEHGIPESVDLRIRDRLYFRIQKNPGGTADPGFGKEVE